MTGKALATLLAFFLILITAGLIYFDEHVLINNFENYARSKVDVLLSNLKHEIEAHLVKGEVVNLFKFISSYKKFSRCKDNSVI
ncbi:hypothetical protein JGI25_01663 [Candidatus Kryptobacter tengchongensis]|uniref:Uncharacterized protein n=1 Tax=Kryptobacter tengchongensis TaxID=1643429 RepID=A0A916PEX4_KRYT1|nr:hypothetical protein JGI25_01663 [Candidatus Kryptobacter tengchongensis]